MKRFVVCVALLFIVTVIPFEVFAEEIKLEFWHHTYPPATDWMRGKIKDFEKTHENVSITLTEYPHGDYEVKLLAAIAAGNSPDIINLLDYLFPKYVDKGLLAPVNPEMFGVSSTEEVKGLYIDRAVEGLEFDGKLYGVPAENNTMAMFLNAKHFEEVGLDAYDPANWPTTWDKLFELAEKLTVRDKDGVVTRSGFNWVWGLDLYWYAQQYWPVLEQYGCKVYDENGKAAINSPECVAAFEETWLRLVNENIGGPNLASRNAVSGLQDFQDGRQSICYAGLWAPPMWRSNPEIYANYVPAPFPQKDPENPKALLQAYALAVSSSCKHPDVAWEFLNFMTSDSGGMLGAGGYISGRKGWDQTPEAKNMKGVDVFSADMKHGSYVWSSATFSEEATAIKNAIESFAQGKVTVQEALDKCVKELDAIRSE